MGKGIIKQNRGGGLYSVEIVYDRSAIDAELALLATKRAALVDKLYAGSPAQDDEIRLQLMIIDKRVAFLNEKVPQNQTVNSYCVDYTDDFDVDDVVGTIEFARSTSPTGQVGEDLTSYDSIMIQPGWDGNAVYDAERDGILSYPLAQSAAGAFLSLALNPWAMKWKPRYRWGTVTAVNGNYCDVQLADLTFVQDDKNLIDIDQALLLEGVSIEYMDCNGDAFNVGDEVTVEFTDQDWSQPKVIGFYDEPKPCGIFYYSIVFAWYGPADIKTHWYDHLYFMLDPMGDLTWLTDEEVDALSVNTDDWFTKTFQRLFAPNPTPTNYSFPGDKYAVGNPQPEIWENFESLHGNGFNYYTPGGVNFFYQIEDLKIHIFQSDSAIGVSTSKFTKTWLQSHLRTVTTETGITHTPGRWDGFYILADDLLPGVYSRLITSFSSTGIVLIEGVPTDISAYMTGVPGYYYSRTYHEGCIWLYSRTVYDSVSSRAKDGYGEGTPPTIDNVLNYIQPNDATAILNRWPNFPYTETKYWSAGDMQDLADSGWPVDYYAYQNYDGTFQEPEIRVSPRTCGGSKMGLYGYTAQGILGYGDEVINGPWWVFPRDDHYWSNPFDSVEDARGYSIVGENWQTPENDSRGTNNWYNIHLADGDNKTYQVFWAEVSGDYRLVINYKYRDDSKSIVLIIEKNGTYKSELEADEYQPFQEGNTMLYERDATQILTNESIAATPPHFSDNWAAFYSAKKAEYAAQGKTLNFTSSIWPILN